MQISKAIYEVRGSQEGMQAITRDINILQTYKTISPKGGGGEWGREESV